MLSAERQSSAASGRRNMRLTSMHALASRQAANRNPSDDSALVSCSATLASKCSVAHFEEKTHPAAAMAHVAMSIHRSCHSRHARGVRKSTCRYRDQTLAGRSLASAVSSRLAATEMRRSRTNVPIASASSQEGIL